MHARAAFTLSATSAGLYNNRLVGQAAGWGGCQVFPWFLFSLCSGPHRHTGRADLGQLVSGGELIHPGRGAGRRRRCKPGVLTNPVFKFAQELWILAKKSLGIFPALA